MYDPEHDHWELMAVQQKDRSYHSTALLLPDGRVISMGSNPTKKCIEPTIEIFSPPYLFNGSRPKITASPETISYDETFEIELDLAEEIVKVVLMRPSALTHVTNTDQRLLELEISGINGKKIKIHGPKNQMHMPEGYVMIFAINKEEIPSVAKFLHLS